MRAPRFTIYDPKPAIGTRVEHYTGWQGVVTGGLGGEQTILVRPDGPYPQEFSGTLYSKCDFSLAERS